MLAIYRSGRAIISKTPTRLTTIYIPTWGYLREPLSRTHRIPARFRASWRVLSKTETITPTCSLSIPTGIIRQFSGSQMDGTIWRATWRPAQAPAAPAIGSSQPLTTTIPRHGKAMPRFRLHQEDLAMLNERQLRQLRNFTATAARRR